MTRYLILCAVFLALMVFSPLHAGKGAWSAHSFPSTYSSQPLVRCGETVALCVNSAVGKASVYDIKTDKWFDVSMTPPVIDLLASGEVLFLFNENTIIGYSSIASKLDSLHFLESREILSCNILRTGPLPLFSILHALSHIS